MRSEPITLACMSTPRLENLRQLVPKVLPFVDKAIIVIGRRDQECIQYLESLGSKVQVIYRPWDDSFANQWNEFLKHMNDGWSLVCHDKETEVLTNDGWKLFKDLKQTEDVLTLNSKTNELEYQKPTKYINYKYSGDIYSFNGKAVSFGITAGHKMYFSPNNSKKNYILKPIEQMIDWKKVSILSGGIWKGKVPTSNLVNGIDNKTLLKLVGWILAEGWTYQQEFKNHPGTFRNKIYISQTKPETKQEIIDLIRSIGSSPIQDNDHTIVFYHKSLFDFIHNSLGYGADNKQIPSKIKELCPELLEYMLLAYLRGDGSQNGSSWTFSTVSETLVNDIQEIAIKLGWRCTFKRCPPSSGGINKDGRRIIGKRDIYCGCISKRIDSSIYTEDINRIYYDDMVYCVTVPNHIICTRKNGRVMFAGNCDDDEIPSDNLLKALDEYINKSAMGKNFSCVEIRCNPISEGQDLGPCNYYRQMLFRYQPNMKYQGGPKTGCHQYLVGYQNNRIIKSRDNEVYYHIKSLKDEYRNASRNYFIYGIWLHGAQDGIQREEWHELKKLVSKHYPNVNTFMELDDILITGNIHPELKEWMSRRYKEFCTHPEYNEMKALPMYYFKYLHPEECPQELNL